MRKPLLLLPALFVMLLGILLWHPWRTADPVVVPPPDPIAAAPAPTAPGSPDAPAPLYATGPASPDGTGRFYMGREIARVMGHEAIDWLERPQRESEESPSKAIAALDLAPDARIADIGAGSGYYSFRIADLVPEGEVVAVDIQPEMVAVLESTAEARGVTNVVPHLSQPESVGLDAESIDAALMVDAYHEFSDPREMMESIVTALRPGGRVFLLEYRAEDPAVAIKPLHKMTEAQAVKEMEAAGLEWERTEEFLPMQHFMVFRKPAD